MTEPSITIEILVEPQKDIRERYTSELDPLRKRKRSQRFIRGEKNFHNHEHPTIAISQLWDRNRKYYIRITLTTVPNSNVPVACVHPYLIDTSDFVIRDRERNTLFFPLTPDDFTAGFKSFRITRKKLTQYELRNYGLFRVINTDQFDIQRVDDLRDARRIIHTYELNKSQLIFSLAELILENQLPVIYDATTTYSIIMTAIRTTPSNSLENGCVRCVPKRGSWAGGDEILMVIPKFDRRKSFQVIVEYGTMKQTENISAEIVDTKTISFITPPCPSPMNNCTISQIPFVVLQNDHEIARVNFDYQSNRTLTVENLNLVEEIENHESSSTTDVIFDEILFDDNY